jgi:hypothetical protein
MDCPPSKGPGSKPKDCVEQIGLVASFTNSSWDLRWMTLSARKAPVSYPRTPTGAGAYKESEPL